jgi:hypothetical protein
VVVVGARQSQPRQEKNTEKEKKKIKRKKKKKKDSCCCGWLLSLSVRCDEGGNKKSDALRTYCFQKTMQEHKVETWCLV